MTGFWTAKLIHLIRSNMETYGERSEVEQLQRNTGNKSQDSEENSSFEAGLNVTMSAFFQASFQSWRRYVVQTDTRSIILQYKSCTIFIFSRLTCVLKPLGLWKHIVNCNNANYEKIRGENWRRSTNFFWIEMAAVKMKSMCCSLGRVDFKRQPIRTRYFSLASISFWSLTFPRDLTRKLNVVVLFSH